MSLVDKSVSAKDKTQKGLDLDTMFKINRHGIRASKSQNIPKMPRTKGPLSGIRA